MADKVEGNGVDARVEGSHVDADVIHHQQEAGRAEGKVHHQNNRKSQNGEQWVLMTLAVLGQSVYGYLTYFYDG